MWKTHQISPSDQGYLIKGFDVIAAIANSLRTCHTYMASTDGYVYGCPEDGFCLCTFKIPPQFIPPIDFIFRVDSLNMDLVNQYKDFIYYKGVIDWAVFPVATKDLHHHYKEALIDNVWQVIPDDPNGLADIVELYKPESDKAMFFSLLKKNYDGFKTAFLHADMSEHGSLCAGYYFPSVHETDAIQFISNNKIAQGRKFMYLTAEDGTTFGCYVFRNLFNFNKNDSIDLFCYPRTDYRALFLAKYVLTRKNNPLKDKLKEYELYDEYKTYTFDIYVQYLNIK